MNKGRKTDFVALIVFMFALSFLGCPSQDQSSNSSALNQKPPEENKVFQNLVLPFPQTEEERTYLGITGEGSFKISHIKAQVLIIEIFSNLCPHCHKEAPLLNELYRAIEERPDLKEKIKMIGIGAANDVSENGKFRDMHRVPFPLFPDKDLSITAGALGISATPTFIGVKINADGSLKSFYSKSGPFGELSAFLAQVLQLSGLEKVG